MKKYLFLSIILLTFVTKLNAQTRFCEEYEVHYVPYRYFKVVQALPGELRDLQTGLARAYKNSSSKEFDYVYLIYDKEDILELPTIHDDMGINLNNNTKVNAYYVGTYTYIDVNNTERTLKMLFIVRNDNT